MIDQIPARLFEDDPGWGEAPVRVAVPLAGASRVLLPNRVQLELRARDLESLLPEGHRARLVWAWAERADLGALYAKHPRGGRRQRAYRHGPGDPVRPVVVRDPGEGGPCTRAGTPHDASRRLRLDLRRGIGQRPYPLGFRSAHGETFDALLTDHVAILLAEGVVSLKRVAQDGVRVRARAGAASFRRAATLEACLEQAREQVERLKGQHGDDPGAVSRRQQAATRACRPGAAGAR